MYLIKRMFIVFLGLFVLNLTNVWANDFSSQDEKIEYSDSAQWRIRITPYAWTPSMNGHFSPFKLTPTFRVEASISDVLKDYNGGGFLYFIGVHDRFVVIADLMYVKLGRADVLGPNLLMSLGLNTHFPIDLKGKVDMFEATLMGGYRLFDTSAYTLDMLGGLRYYSVDTNVKGSFATVDLLSIRSSFEWTDPIVGTRLLYNFDDKISLLAQADVGGFDVGSKLSWQVLAALNYTFNDRFSLSIGYKALSVDYEKHDHVFDSTLRGPAIGLSIRF